MYFPDFQTDPGGFRVRIFWQKLYIWITLDMFIITINKIWIFTPKFFWADLARHWQIGTESIPPFWMFNSCSLSASSPKIHLLAYCSISLCHLFLLMVILCCLNSLQSLKIDNVSAVKRFCTGNGLSYFTLTSYSATGREVHPQSLFNQFTICQSTFWCRDCKYSVKLLSMNTNKRNICDEIEKRNEANIFSGLIF